MPLTPLLVAQISDTHLFAEEHQTLLGLPTARSLKAVVGRIETLRHRPDLLLLTGDLSQDETLASYQRLQALLSPLDIPAYWIPGNHDDLAVMSQGLSAAPLLPEKSFRQGDWNFVLLNSALPGCVEGALPVDRLNWLVQQLERLGNLPTVVALHHPPLPIASAWMDDISLRAPDTLFAVLERYPQVKLVLFGHIHQAFDRAHRGIRYLGTPSTCVQFKPKSQRFAVDAQQPGFRLLNLNADGSFTTWIERVSWAHQLDLAATGY